MDAVSRTSAIRGSVINQYHSHSRDELLREGGDLSPQRSSPGEHIITVNRMVYATNIPSGE